ncbi:MAG: hypothetical protein ABI406_05645 [Ktedonobacteraceae bacterium]
MLEEIYHLANVKWSEQAEGEFISWQLPEQLVQLLTNFWNNAIGNAVSAITNLTTCLVCKGVEPSVDCRYHREPREGMPQPPDGPDNYFSGRTISEKVVAPWLRSKNFVTSRSGWQTRTFERLQPYTLDYPEHIAHVKDEFLHILDEVQSGNDETAKDALVYLFFKQIEHRDMQRIQLTIPSISNIETITAFFQAHFFAHYTQKGASRLPVLAMHAIYTCVMPESERYHDYSLAPLQSHEAADARTGAIGDIEIFDEQANIFEAFEIKHDISIDKEIIRTAYDKFRSFPSLKRYYILTTADSCGGQDGDSQAVIRRIRDSHGAEVIVNGVVPTIKYFLRLLKNPASIFPAYVHLLEVDTTITYEHKQTWNDVVIGQQEGIETNQHL